MITLNLPYEIAALNRVWSSPHWSVRKQAADEAHAIVRAAAWEQLPLPIEPFPSLAQVSILSYAVRPRDVDAVAKLVLDGLVFAGVLQDDGYRHVERLVLETHKVKRQHERIVVVIQEA